MKTLLELIDEEIEKKPMICELTYEDDVSMWELSAFSSIKGFHHQQVWFEETLNPTRKELLTLIKSLVEALENIADTDRETNEALQLVCAEIADDVLVQAKELFEGQKK